MTKVTFGLPLESSVATFLQTNRGIEQIHDLTDIATAGGSAALGLIEDEGLIRGRVAIGVTEIVTEEDPEAGSALGIGRILRIQNEPGMRLAALITSHPESDGADAGLLPKLPDVLRYAPQSGKQGGPELRLHTILGRATLVPNVGGIVLATIWPAQGRRPARGWDKLIIAGGYDDASSADQTRMLLSAGFDTGRQLLRRGRTLSAGRDPDFPDRPRR